MGIFAAKAFCSAVCSVLIDEVFVFPSCLQSQTLDRLLTNQLPLRSIHASVKSGASFLLLRKEVPPSPTRNNTQSGFTLHDLWSHRQVPLSVSTQTSGTPAPTSARLPSEGKRSGTRKAVDDITALSPPTLAGTSPAFRCLPLATTRREGGGNGEL